LTARNEDNDLPDIRPGLTDRAAALFERLYDKPSKVRGHELRWGRKGSLVLYLRGRNGPHWHCYESGQGGDMLAAIQHALSTDFVDALDWARDWLGTPRRDGRRRKQHRAEPQPDRQGKPADYDAEQLEKARRAAELSAAAGPIAGTAAETYLRTHRGIKAAAWPDALGFADAATVGRCTGWRWWRWPALVMRATDATGVVTGVQLVALQPDGSAAKHWEHDGKLKLSFGTLRGTAVRLPGDDRALLLAEGPETGLSCWWATGIETWANLGSIARAPLADVALGRLIVVCADDDPRNAPANKALRDAIRGWRREGRRIVLVKPHALTQRDKSDFNDTLRAEGREAVRNRIMAAIDEHPAPDSPLSVAEARKQAAKLIDDAIDELLDKPGKPATGLDLDPFSQFASETLDDDAAPFKVLRLPTGIGKTEIAIRRAVRATAGGAKIIYLVPTHKLGAELVGRIGAEARGQGVTVIVDTWRGRNQDRPDKPGEKMCSEPEMIAAALAAKADTGEVCKICPAAAECPYLAQHVRSARIWVGAHDLLWHEMPPPLEGADLVIIDEGFATRGLIGFSGKPRFITEAELAAVPEVDRVSLEADLRELLMPLRRKLVTALRDHPKGALRRDHLIEAGLTVEDAREARPREWWAKAEVKLRRKTWRGAKKALDKAAKQNRMIPLFAALWHAAEDLLTEDGWPASGRAVIGDYEVDGTTVRLFGVESITAEWRRTPTLHIDATVDMTLLRCRVPHAKLVGEIEAAAPHMRVVQYPDRAFGKLALRNERFLFKVWDWCVAYASTRGGDWGVVVPKEAEITIRAAREVPDFIKLHHFGALRGLDELKGVRGLIAVGRPMAAPGEVERIAGALSGGAVQAVEGDWYPAEVVQIRARDGSVASVEADRHPDPLAEAVRASIAEGELLQSIGRARGLNRTAENPVEVVLLTNVPVLGVTPDELRQWEGPIIDEEIFARLGAALESAGDAAKAAGLTRKAVLRARENSDRTDRGWPHFRISNLLYGNGANLCQAIYQLSGPGRSRQRVVYDQRRIADCRAWLTERLGPLAYFEEVEADGEPVETEPAAEPGSPEQTPADPAESPPADALAPAAGIGICAGLWAPAPDPALPSPVVASRSCTAFVAGEHGHRLCGRPAAGNGELCTEHQQRRDRLNAALGATAAGATAPVVERQGLLPMAPPPMLPVGLEWLFIAPQRSGPGEAAWLCCGLGVRSRALMASRILARWIREAEQDGWLHRGRCAA
jgi:putative DNA primase/helicase